MRALLFPILIVASTSIVEAQNDEDVQQELLAAAAGQLSAPEPGRPSPALTSSAPVAATTATSGEPSLDWLQGLTTPNVPIRWDDRVVRLLAHYRNNPRGRAHMAAWLRREPRYAEMMRSVFRAHNLPTDLIYVAMIESGFDPSVDSRVGATGLWQFVRATGEGRGLSYNRWTDMRRSPEDSTRAAAEYLADLHRRLGSWELALAAYNMGYGALTRAIRKYNTNDFWVLAQLEAGLPHETIIYVAKFMACAVVGRNPERFGFGDLARDAAIEVRRTSVPAGTRLTTLARSAGIDVETLSALNPELRRDRVPPGAEPFSIRVPAANADRFAAAWARRRTAQRERQRRHTVRFGENLQAIARRYRTSQTYLVRMNQLDSRNVRTGDVLLVPDVEPRETADSTPIVTIPAREFHYTDRRRVFYRVASADTPATISRFFGVSVDELRRWNAIDTGAALLSGMMVQLFIAPNFDLTRAIVISPDDVRILVVGSDAFFDYHEAQRDRTRIRYTVRERDSLASIAERFELSIGSVARINQFSRRTTLTPGQQIILYVPNAQANAGRAVTTALTPTAETEAGPAAPTTPATPEVPAPAAPPSAAPATGSETPAEPAEEAVAEQENPERA